METPSLSVICVLLIVNFVHKNGKICKLRYLHLKIKYSYNLELYYTSLLGTFVQTHYYTRELTQNVQ